MEINFVVGNLNAKIRRYPQVIGSYEIQFTSLVDESELDFKC